MVAEQVDFGKKIALVQDEIGLVKEQLKTGGKHFGMEGQVLSDYLLQLTKQECSLLEIVARAMEEGVASSTPTSANGGTTSRPAPPPPAINHQQPPSAAPLPPATYAHPTTNTQLTGANRGKPLENAPTLDRESSLEAVLAHLDYVKDAYSSDVDLYCRTVCKGLKLLTSLVYKTSNAKTALDKGVLALLECIMRQHDIGDGSIAGFVAGSVCNLAYDVESCETVVGSPLGITLLISLLNAMSLFPTHAYLHQKGSETFARILMEGVAEGTVAEMVVKNGATASATESADPRYLPASCTRSFAFIRVLCLARGRVASSLTSSENATKSTTPAMQEEQFAHYPLLETLIRNEALTVDALAADVVANLRHATSEGRWFEAVFVGLCGLSSTVCASADFGIDFSLLLRKHGMTELMLDTMKKKPLSQVGARAAIEAVARIISTSMEGLQLFVKLGGVHCFQSLMDMHQADKILLARAIRALASGMDWPEEVQAEAKFDHLSLILKTHAAMGYHLSDPWLLCAGFEGFYKFLPHISRDETMAIYKVEAMVKDVMSRYADDVKLKAWGSRILDMINM
ncbi:unnamed protein product [Amoebophrya sp. A120]|nr:unnamed protein product [Amoebophrya sp. A120]|eukprot:GSA120T00020199001.1